MIGRCNVSSDLHHGAVVVAVDVVQQAHDSPKAALLSLLLGGDCHESAPG